MKVFNVQISGFPTFIPILKGFEEIKLKRHYPEAQWKYYDSNKEGKAKDFWILVNPITIVIQTNKGTYSLTNRPCWITDFGSVPLRLRSIVSHVDPRLIVAYLAHDMLYAHKGRFTKKESDLILREVARYYGAGAWLRTKVYQSVNLFGRKAWNSGLANLMYEREWLECNFDPRED